MELVSLNDKDNFFELIKFLTYQLFHISNEIEFINTASA